MQTADDYIKQSCFSKVTDETDVSLSAGPLTKGQ